MRIERPLPETRDLVIVYDLIDPSRLERLVKYYISNVYHLLPEMTDERRAALGHVPKFRDCLYYADEAFETMDIIRESTKDVMSSEFGFKVERFQDFGMPGIREPGSSMKPHVDGPPEYNNPEHGIKNLGANFYLNDNYVGGELTYPHLNFEYKPIPNSVVIHRGEELFRHGVNEVKSGWRLGFGMFAFENYDLAPLEHGMDSDK
jgi:hypothetical protein